MIRKVNSHKNSVVELQTCSEQARLRGHGQFDWGNMRLFEALKLLLEHFSTSFIFFLFFPECWWQWEWTSLWYFSHLKPFSGISWRKLFPQENCSGFFNFFSSRGGMLWVFRHKWCWEDDNSINAYWYNVTSLSLSMEVTILIRVLTHLIILYGIQTFT